MNGILKVHRQGAVLRLTLADDATRNSLSEKMIAALAQEFNEASADQTLSVIIVAAEGKAFSSGHNLKELTAHRADSDQGHVYFKNIFEGCASLMTTIAQHRCVTIAEVQGLASAAGCQLVASCDFAYANENASFCTPGVNIGLFCSTPMVALSRSISPRHAREMLLSGAIYDAQYALRVGLINEMLPHDKLSARVNAIANELAQKSQTAIQYGKPAFDAQLNLRLEDAYADCSTVMVKNMMDHSAREGISAVLEKRKAEWPPA
jgi:enoyl-CoA hydratase/carnithine racemase